MANLHVLIRLFLELGNKQIVSVFNINPKLAALIIIAYAKNKKLYKRRAN
jgi:hypothetical protein